MKVDGNEISRVGVVGVDAANFGSCDNNKLGLFSYKKGFDVRLASEVELGMRAKDQIGETELVELADDGRADEATVTSYEYLRGFVREKRICGYRKVNSGLEQWKSRNENVKMGSLNFEETKS